MSVKEEQKILDELKVEQKIVESATNILRTEYRELKRLITQDTKDFKERELNTQAAERIVNKRIEEATDDLRVKRIALQDEDRRIQALFTVVKGEKEKNLNAKINLKKEEEGLLEREEKAQVMMDNAQLLSKGSQDIRSDLNIKSIELESQRKEVELKNQHLSEREDEFAKTRIVVSKERTNLKKDILAYEQDRADLLIKEKDLIGKRSVLHTQQEAITVSKTAFEAEVKDIEVKKQDIVQQNTEIEKQLAEVAKEKERLESWDKNLISKDIQLKEMMGKIIEKQGKLREELRMVKLKAKGII